MNLDEEQQPLLPRWSPIGIGLGNVALAALVHAISGSRAAAVTFAAVLIAVIAAYAAYLRSRPIERLLVSRPESTAPVPRRPEAGAPPPEESFVIVRPGTRV